MAIGKLSEICFFVLACALAGLCHGEDKDCATDMKEVFPQVVTCITKKHPEYFFLVLTKMKNFAAMESPDFMCKNQGLMVTATQCLVQYEERCVKNSMGIDVAKVMPTEQTIKKGVRFLCAHRKDFDDPCVKSRLSQVGECLSSEMQTYSRVTRSASLPHNMLGTLCSALGVEEKCLDSGLKGCRAKVIADLKDALRDFCPADETPQVLRYQPERHH